MVLEQLLQSDLSVNASRYDWMRAASNPLYSSVVWSTWILTSGIASLAGITILAGILSSSTARRDTFNQYIIGLVIPDVLFSSACSVSCVLNLLASTYYGGTAWCAWQSFYVVFGFCGSVWMQVLIASEIRTVIRTVHAQRVYTPPQPARVLVQVACVYSLSAFWACWIFIPGLPIAENAMAGLSCLPVAYSVGSELFLWAAYLVPITITPICIVGCFVRDTRHMHASLDAKTLALLRFFSTIFAVLLAMWVPSIVLIYTLEPRGVGFWITSAGGAWSHAQGIVSASLYLRKPDIRQAIAELPLLRYLLGPWLRLAHEPTIVRRLGDCIEGSLLPSTRGARTERLSEWDALAYVQEGLQVVEYGKGELGESRHGRDIVNKATIDADISVLLGHGGRCASFEFIFVENVQPSFYLTPKWLFGGFGPAFGHAAIAYTRADGTRKLVNIVGGREAAGGREMVELWEQPYDYMYGDHGKGGIFARSMCVVRVQDWDARGIEAIELYVSAMLASYRASRARWHNCASCITLCSWMGPTEWRISPSGNCSDWLSRGCFLAGLVRRPHTFPKAALVDIIEHFIFEQPAKTPHAQVIYLKQDPEACRARTWQRRAVWRSWTAPLHLLRNIIYWDLEPFADAVVQVQRTADGELRASVAPGQRRRPEWLRRLIRARLMHTPLLAVFCVGWIACGWPQADTPMLSATIARVFMAFGVLIVNAVLY